MDTCLFRTVTRIPEEPDAPIEVVTYADPDRPQWSIPDHITIALCHEIREEMRQAMTRGVAP